jgi:hypothetical protein
MNITRLSKLLIANSLLFALFGCNSAPSQDTSCTMPVGHDIDQAISASKFQLETGCAAHFDRYFTSLLSIASGDPRKENKGKFSDFLLWANQTDLISKNQARAYYNRYFGVKYVSMKGDYSVCSEACPKRSQLLRDMRSELGQKELGLAKVSADASTYHRANQLYNETEIVLEATCTACGPLEQN